MTGFALGASLGGLYPIHIHIRNDFLPVAMNQLVNCVAKYKYMYGGLFEVPMLIRAVIGRSWGQGGTHSRVFKLCSLTSRDGRSSCPARPKA